MIIQNKGVHQPLTFYLLKPFYEKILPCMGHTDLNMKEMDIYTQLQLDYNIPFDLENKKHIDLLKQLFMKAFQKQLEENITHQDWLLLGFQQENPTTDFRGAGLQGLLDIMHIFNQFERKRISALIDSQKNYQFLLALVSLNITFLFKQYFHLSKNLDVKKDKQKICSREILKNLCRVMNYEEAFLRKLHCFIVIIIYSKWIKHCKQNTNYSIYELQNVNMTIIDMFKKFTEQNQMIDFESFQLMFLNELSKKNILQVQDLEFKHF